MHQELPGYDVILLMVTGRSSVREVNLLLSLKQLLSFKETANDTIMLVMNLESKDISPKRP
jgi:hypothetical protein